MQLGLENKILFSKLSSFSEGYAVLCRFIAI